jgi:hypothetical protein
MKTIFQKDKSGMKRSGCIAAGILLGILAAGEAFAAHPLVGDDTGTHGLGKYQLEVNGEAGFDRQKQGGVETKTASQQVATIVSAGLDETVDLVVGIPWQWTRVKQDGSLVAQDNGAGDASLEVKWRFYEQPGFSLAVKPGLLLPTGDAARGFGTGRIGGSIFLIATRELAPVTLHLNAGYVRNEFRRDEDRQANRNDIMRASLSTLTEVVKNLQLAAEIGLESNSDRTSRTWPAFILGGLIYSVRDNIELDFGIKHGLNEPATDLSLLAGLSVHF